MGWGKRKEIETNTHKWLPPLWSKQVTAGEAGKGLDDSR